MKPSRDLRNLFLAFWRDLSEADPSLTDGFSLSPDALGFGTDPREFWIGGQRIRTILRAQMLATGPLQVNLGHISAFEEGTVGWAASTGSLTLRDGTKVEVRGTSVFHREDDQWKMIQFHASVGAENAEYWGDDFTVSFEAMVALLEQEQPDLSSSASSEGTVTIMFTDIESSTATNESMGDDQWIPIVKEHNRILRDQVEAQGGTVVQHQGDGFMLAFPSARRAVECAIAVQRAVAEISAEPPVRVRMGMHTGEPMRDAKGFYGRDIAYAARVGSAAVGGEILVSSLAKSLIEPSGAFSFESARQLELKGFEGPQQVFAVSWT